MFVVCGDGELFALFVVCWAFTGGESSFFFFFFFVV